MIKNSWNLCKTNKIKPMGYKGYIFTLYEKDDITIKAEVKNKTAWGIFNKILMLLEKG